MPADDFPGEYVDDGRNVPESVDEPEVREVPGPDDVWLNWADDL